MEKTPFSVYDFFAYLSSGGLLVFTFDFLFGKKELLQNGLAIAIYALAIVISYVVGQLIAQLSAVLFEQVLVKRWMREPVYALLSTTPANGVRRWLFPGFYRPLPSGTQERVQAQLEGRGCTLNGNALFLHCYAAATRENDKLQGRLDDFRNQYGFARNMALSFLLVSLAIVIAHFTRREINVKWSLVSLAVAIGMLYRYLKFFRQYCYELLVRYSESNQSQA